MKWAILAAALAVAVVATIALYDPSGGATYKGKPLREWRRLAKDEHSETKSAAIRVLCDVAREHPEILDDLRSEGRLNYAGVPDHLPQVLRTLWQYSPQDREWIASRWVAWSKSTTAIVGRDARIAAADAIYGTPANERTPEMTAALAALRNDTDDAVAARASGNFGARR